MQFFTNIVLWKAQIMTNIKKPQTIQNTDLQIAGYTQHTNIQHLKCLATQLKQLTQTQTHPLHDLNAYSVPPRLSRIKFNKILLKIHLC